MGRIQRKKATAKSKKKKQAASAQQPANKDGAVSEQKSVAVVASKKEAAKRPAEIQKKTAATSKSTINFKFWDKSVQFLREVKVELKKVTWPSRKQTLGSTLVVIILVMIISVFLGMVDVGLSNIIRLALQ